MIGTPLTTDRHAARLWGIEHLIERLSNPKADYAKLSGLAAFRQKLEDEKMPQLALF